ncbi:MAG TPA: hypothetical protein VNA17_10280 [Pyrinomonadaceae bacterium]|nr:hypothetical protein [Pyrinomonadaceae bacterium]
MFLRSRNIFALCLVVATLAISAFGQAAAAEKPAKQPKPTPTPKGAPATAEQVVETAIFFYGSRPLMSQIRKTTLERGTVSASNAEGNLERANYQRFIIRADTLSKEKIRLDQELPTARYSLVFNDSKIFGIYNNNVFTPRDDAAKSFENQILHSLEAFLRYKENESTLELAGREKLQGVDYYLIDVTDKQGNKTRFYVSAKQFRVMILTYEDGGVKYKRRFYDYNYAQNTLVPFRSVLWADDKIVEETDVGTITFGQKVDEELFKAG